ncbi:MULTISPECIES: YafY family protein [Paenibacillus]|uniref:helix-turn-helix transcriptional regulator n=1 Tax=Paenibacillus TaxID=44249 RepID=UPI002FDF3BE9
MSKADQMLSILWMLRSGRKMTAQEIAERLEIHVRTVYRCIDSLCASGAPIIAEPGPGGGYRILGRFAESPLMFDRDEQKALVHAATFAREAGYPHTQALERAVDKLKLYTNEEQLSEMERHDQGLAVIQPPSEERERNLLAQLEQASAEERTLEMLYDKGKGAPTSRLFDPYGIVHWKGSWYTVGYCRLRGSIRSFRVDRITGLAATEQHFKRPDNFSAKSHLFAGLLPGSLESETLVTVRVSGKEQVLNELCRHWLFGHALVNRGKEEAVFRLGRESLISYVPHLLLPYGRALRILEPDWFIERLVEASLDIADHYGTMSGQPNT